MIYTKEQWTGFFFKIMSEIFSDIGGAKILLV